MIWMTLRTQNQSSDTLPAEGLRVAASSNEPDRGQPRPALGFAKRVMTTLTAVRLTDCHLTGRGASSGGRWAEADTKLNL